MTVAVVGGRIVDGSGREPIEGGVVLIEGERISKVGPASAVTLPKDATVLDAAGRWVLPGIVDSHVHTTYRARDMRQHLLNTPTYNVLRSTSILEETLACGVTSVRDMGGADAGFRAAVEEGIVPGPRMMISLVMISQTGGHGDYWLPAGHRIAKRSWLPDPVADGADGVRRLVRQVLAAGADFIKICATGGITSVTDSWDEPQFTVEELTVAVQEAAAKRKRVAVHAEGIEGIRSTLAAGAWSLEHGWFLDEESIERMVAQGTWWVPTLALVPMSVRKRETDKAWSAQQMAQEDAKDSEIFALMQKQIPLYKEAYRRGVKVAFGTDQSHRLLVGDNLVELEFMVDWVGMSPLEALTSATGQAAACLERDDIGVLEAGRYADLLVVDGAPLDDITCLQKRENLRLVMKGGEAYSNSLTA